MDKTNSRRKNIVLCLSVILIVLIAVLCAVTAYVVKIKKNGKTSGTGDDKGIVDVKNENTDYVLSEEDDTANDESDSDLPVSVESVKKDDSSVEFDTAGNPLQEPNYNTVVSVNFNCTYKVPTHFKVSRDITAGSSRIRYFPEDNTADVCFEFYNNEEAVSASTALSNYCEKIGGEVTYSVTGDDWYAVSIRVGDVLYYNKCFVDEKIRSFEFVFPEMYLEPYSHYIEYMEDNFKRDDS